MNETKRTPQGELVITIAKKFTVTEVDSFRTMMNQKISSGETRILLDMSQCELIDSTGLGLFVALLKRCLENSGNLRLKSLLPNVQKLFQLTRLNHVFEII